MSKTMTLKVYLECDNNECQSGEEQKVDDFCGDSSQVPDIADIDWRENSDGDVFCADCVELANRVLG